MCYLKIAFCACGAQLADQERLCLDGSGLGSYAHIWIVSSYFVDDREYLCQGCVQCEGRKKDLRPYITQCISRAAQACGCEELTLTPEMLTPSWELPGYELVMTAVSRSAHLCGEHGCSANALKQADTMVAAGRTAKINYRTGMEVDSLSSKFLGLVLNKVKASHGAVQKPSRQTNVTAPVHFQTLSMLSFRVVS